MERIHINKMPLYRDHTREDTSVITGRLSGFKLSHLVAHLDFETINERGQVRRDKTKKAVLRALCDRYPKVWPGIEDIAAKAGCSISQARRALRELEHHDKLIVDINSRITWRKPTAQDIKNGHPVYKLVRECDDAGKKGGRGPNCTPQYHICDRKIYDIYQRQEDYKRDKKARAKTNSEIFQVGNPVISDTFSKSETHSSQNKTRSSQAKTHSSEEQNPVIPEQNPVMVTAEPTSINRSVEPIKEPTTSNREQQEEGTNDCLFSPSDWIDGLTEAYTAKTGKLLNRAGKQKLLDLRNGHNDETIESIWNQWLEERDLEGLRCPLIAFVQEFPLVLETMANGDGYAAVVSRVWSYYVRKLGKNSSILTLTPARKEKGLARLRNAMDKVGGNLEKGEELLMIAVDALANSDFHTGANDDGKHYDSWEKSLFGSQEQFERWLEQAGKDRRAYSSPPPAEKGLGQSCAGTQPA